MNDYWFYAKLKLALGRSWVAAGQFEKAELALQQARTSIADHEGVDSARWGVATLDLASCAMWRGNSELALRRGLNAFRVLRAAGPPGSVLPAAEAALVVGQSLRVLQDLERAISYCEFARQLASQVRGEVRILSRVDVQLGFVYSNAGCPENAADAAMRGWATVEHDDSLVRELGSDGPRMIISLLERADRLREALPVWEWLFAHKPNDDAWYRLHKFVGKMAEQGLEQEAIEFFRRIEELERS